MSHTLVEAQVKYGDPLRSGLKKMESLKEIEKEQPVKEQKNIQIASRATQASPY